MFSQNSRFGLLFAAGLTFLVPITAQADDTGKPSSSTAYAESIAFKKPGVGYEAFPMNDRDVIPFLRSLSDSVLKKHYQLRQSRDL